MKTALTILLLILAFILIMLYGVDAMDYLIEHIGRIMTLFIFCAGCFGVYKLTDLLK